MDILLRLSGRTIVFRLGYTNCDELWESVRWTLVQKKAMSKKLRRSLIGEKAEAIKA